MYANGAHWLTATGFGRNCSAIVIAAEEEHQRNTDAAARKDSISSDILSLCNPLADVQLRFGLRLKMQAAVQTTV
jgi:hypothetical protein